MIDLYFVGWMQMLNSAEVMAKVTNKDMTQDRSLIYDDQVCKALKYAECLHVTRKYGMVVCNDTVSIYFK